MKFQESDRGYNSNKRIDEMRQRGSHRTSTERMEEKNQENKEPKQEDKGNSLLRYPSKLFQVFKT